MGKEQVSIVWFKRDLRLEDNTALNAALAEGKNILPLFIFDDEILEELPKNDARVNFIYDNLNKMHRQLREFNSSILIVRGKIAEVWSKLVDAYSIESVYTNKDYEPYAITRDKQVCAFLNAHGIK